MSDYGAIIGGTIGAAIGGMTTFGAGAQWGWMIGSAIGGAWSASQQVIPGPKIGEIGQQTAQEGGPRPIVFGRSHPIAGNIIADGGPRIVVTRERAGKGGPKVESESAFRTYAVGFCEGPITAFLQVWKNNTLVYDIEDPSMEAENEEFLKYARFYLGDYDQMPSPDLESVIGVGEVHGHRGTAYMVLADEDVTDQRGAWSQWKVRVARFPVERPGLWWAISVPEGISEGDRFLWRAQSPHDFSDAEYRGPPNIRLGASGLGTGIAKTPGGEIILYDSSTRYELYRDYDRSELSTPEIIDAPEGVESIRRIRSFDNCIVLIQQNSSSYYVSESGEGPWNEIQVPDGLNLADIAKNDSGRWACYVQLLSDQRFYYSDDPMPTNWIQASSDEYPSNPNGALVSSGQSFTMLGTAGRVFSSPTGSSWDSSENNVVTGLNTGMTGKESNGIILFGSGTSTTVFRTEGGSLSGENIEVGLVVETIDYGNNVWVASGSSTGNVAVFDKAAEEFSLVGMPYRPGRQWKVAFASPSFDYKDGFYPLPELVSELCVRASLAPSRFDVSMLDGVQVRGFTTSAAYKCYESLHSLSQVFFFSPANIGGRVKFVPLGGDSVATVSEDDMIDDDNDVEVDSRRGDSIGIPRVLHLNYYDVLGGLNTDKQNSERPEGARAEGEMSLQTAVVLSHDEAATVVSKNHAMMAETQKGELHVPLPDKYLFLTESDPIHVHYEGKVVRGVISESVVMDGEQRYRVVRDRQSIHTMSVEGLPPAPITPPPSSIVGATLLEVLDIPIVRDSDDALGVYIAVSGVMPAWQGALVELSMDGGQTYIEGHTVRADTIMGSLVTDLGDHPQAFPDTVNSVQVNVPTPYAVLEGTDLAGMMNRRNLAVIGDELVNFSEADEVSEGVWELSHFLRGRKGTDTESHAIGERFVMLSGAIFVPAELVMLDRPVTVRATSLGTDNETIVALTFTGQSQVERSPAYLQVRRDGADVVASWQGVGRIGGGAHVAMGQHFTGYRVTLTDGATTQTHNTPDSEFTGSMSAFSGPVTVRVQQRNNFTGLGPAIEVTI